MDAPLALSRPTRAIKRPRTYWDEFVATDEWYVKELIADVPPDELQAALVDEDFSGSEADFPNAGNEEIDGDYAGEEDSDDDGEESEDLQWSSEGESGGEGSDGESEGSTVG